MHQTNRDSAPGGHLRDWAGAPGVASAADRPDELLPRQVADRIPGLLPRGVRAILDSDLPLVHCTGRFFVVRNPVRCHRTGARR